MTEGSLGPSMHITSLCHSRRAEPPLGKLAYLGWQKRQQSVL